MEVEKYANKAVEYFDEGYNCSQAVFKAFKDNMEELKDIDDNLFAGFGAGFAGKGSLCGTLTAATAIISFYKMNRNDPKNRKALYELLGKFYTDFENIYGSVNCRDIIKVDFTTAEGFALYKNEKHESVCKYIVKDVVKHVYAELFNS